MNKKTIIQLWEDRYGTEPEVYDYAGRRMVKAACGDRNSSCQPTVDHIRPRAQGGRNVDENLVICNWETNGEKGDHFPHWKANGRRFCAKREGCGYRILDLSESKKR